MTSKIHSLAKKYFNQFSDLKIEAVNKLESLIYNKETNDQQIISAFLEWIAVLNTQTKSSNNNNSDLHAVIKLCDDFLNEISPLRPLAIYYREKLYPLIPEICDPLNETLQTVEACTDQHALVATFKTMHQQLKMELDRSKFANSGVENTYRQALELTETFLNEAKKDDIYLLARVLYIKFENIGMKDEKLKKLLNPKSHRIDQLELLMVFYNLKQEVETEKWRYYHEPDLHEGYMLRCNNLQQDCQNYLDAVKDLFIKDYVTTLALTLKDYAKNEAQILASGDMNTDQYIQYFIDLHSQKDLQLPDPIRKHNELMLTAIGKFYGGPIYQMALDYNSRIKNISNNPDRFIKDMDKFLLSINPQYSDNQIIEYITNNMKRVQTSFQLRKPDEHDLVIQETRNLIANMNQAWNRRFTAAGRDNAFAMAATINPYFTKFEWATLAKVSRDFNAFVKANGQLVAQSPFFFHSKKSEATKKWKNTNQYNKNYPLLLLHKDYLITSNDKLLQKIHPFTGYVLKTLSFEEKIGLAETITAISLCNDRLVCAAGSKAYILNPDNLEIVKELQIGKGIIHSILQCRNQLIFYTHIIPHGIPKYNVLGYNLLTIYNINDWKLQRQITIKQPTIEAQIHCAIIPKEFRMAVVRSYYHPDTKVPSANITLWNTYNWSVYNEGTYNKFYTACITGPGNEFLVADTETYLTSFKPSPLIKINKLITYLLKLSNDDLVVGCNDGSIFICNNTVAPVPLVDTSTSKDKSPILYLGFNEKTQSLLSADKNGVTIYTSELLMQKSLTAPSLNNNA